VKVIAGEEHLGRVVILVTTGMRLRYCGIRGIEAPFSPVPRRPLASGCLAPTLAADLAYYLVLFANGLLAADHDSFQRQPERKM